MVTGKGLHLGHFYDERTGHYGPRRLYEGDRHGFVCAATGTGKTSRLVAVNLLSGCLDDASTITFDPKGELAITCMQSLHQRGHDVKLIDPYGLVKEMAEAKPDVYRYLLDNGLTESVGFNPLTWLNGDDLFYDGAAQLADALIEINSKEPHWPESSQGLLAGLLMWEKRRNAKRANLESVRHLLTEPDVYESVVGADGTKELQLVRGLTVTARHMVEKGGYEIASLAARFAGRMTNEIASIRSSADTQTRWILSKRMRSDLKKVGFDFAQLKHGDRPAHVLIVQPSERMSANKAWLRSITVSALRALYGPGGRRTVMFIDEMPVLGYLRPLSEAYGLIRSMRVQVVGFVQNIGQLQQLYPDWETMIANSGFVQFLTPNDLTTAEWMSRRSGQSTVLAKGISESAGLSSGGNSERDSTSWSQVARRAYLVHELFGLAEGTGFLWLAGMAHTVKFMAPAYYELQQCAARALPNPYYEG